MQLNELNIRIRPSKAYEVRDQPKAPIDAPIDSVPGGLNTVKKIVIRGVITDGSSSN